MSADPELVRINLDTACQALMDIATALDLDTAQAIANKAFTTIIARRMGVPAMPVEGRFSITIPAPDPHRQAWAKWVIAVDRAVHTGYAFEGPFLKVGLAHSLPAGALILRHESDRGTKQNVAVQLLAVENDGRLIDMWATGGRFWAKELSEKAAAFLSYWHDPR